VSIRHGLLALLRDEPKHGYQLKTEFERATGGMWTVNVGQIYTTLDRLVRDGCVDVSHDGDGDQKQYRLTIDGYDELGAWWEALPREDPPPRDELMVKVLLAIATRPDDALAVITAQRTAVLELLQRRRRDQRATAASGATVAQQLADDALVVRAESDLRWLDLCESRLTTAASRSRSPQRKDGT
jgi:DNA-binding PadR family transcriptional regulator